MRVLVLFKDNGRGGLTTNTKALVTHLRKKNIFTVVAGCDGLGTRTALKDLDVQIIDFGSKNIFKVFKQMSAIIKKNQIDIIHSQNRIPALYAAVYCFFNRKVKYLWSNLLVPIPSDFLHRISTKYGEFAIAESLEGRDMLINDFHIPKEKVKLVNLGCENQGMLRMSDEECTELKKSLGISNEETVIFLYGRLTEHKGHLFLIDSLGAADIKKPFKLIFPGDGTDEYKKQIIDTAKKYGFEERIIFPGFIDGREYLSISDLMVLPSKREGYPLSCLDAFVMGVPVIRTKTGGYIDTADYCFGVDYGDTDSFSVLLEEFFDEDSKFSSKVNLALKDAEKFSNSVMVDKYIDIYKEILKDNNL